MEKDVSLLKGRLDLYSDEWRTAQPDTQFKAAMPSLIPTTNKAKKTKIRKNAKESSSNTQGLPSNPTTTTKGTKNSATKRKRTKTDKEKDPNAPKRPANPFFQFCQEQRSILMDELNSELMPGEPELSKQELTRQLANRWRDNRHY